MSTRIHRITLVCSLHRENGLCNVEELLKVLRAMEPDTVFEEIRPADFDSYRRFGKTVEAQALARLYEFKSFRRVPVDRYDIPEDRMPEIKARLDDAFDYVEQRRLDYRLLIEERDERVCRQGFGYLNSVAFSEQMARITEIEDKTIIETGDRALIRALETWRHLIQRRDREMVSNIYEYCRQHAVDAGVFLLGAAHKAGIVKEIREYAGLEAGLIDWTLCS